ncbi:MULTISPECIES: FtsK/SpoIIIE domain-containing protein [Streptomycetaceae]|uniref:FHA domain containing protein n=1 Tax=Streptantibioticus cattleyicolor (strain ATCC 35852 / DSM 46488 / JCM 4925 / NBRC 14057 / NRRL 8057) TaxID=1003195 RepID=F8JUE8_STREN|nr:MULTISPECIES: FtsK/SpoIIIE domain-containing protein [Streptomycetaceae]AEW94358.1 FHA domain containing protein [Streptantibioticus cattleyicolor NRRL 8057 = DSM 46488]MYS59009.1 FHA domain-containing protein [Streptomyces sp. SID5468]CCB74716.1 conserved exported protein of unknown function [Streptantibioticus cattleyicolor NRRL 8057 = DSM 46488]
MQIRLTVLGPRSGRGCDVLVTAPAGTVLGAVAGALAASAGSGRPAPRSGASVVLYAGAQRLDPATARLGVPPLVDGAVLALHAPADPGGFDRTPPEAPARLHVVGGPDAGGVHLLQGGRVRIGRSGDADVPLDDPDVSRLHCVVTVDPAGGRVTVADLGSTNGTWLDGRQVGERAVPVAPGALLRIGESTLRLEAAEGAGRAVPPLPAGPPVVPDAEGHLRVTVAHGSGARLLPAPRDPRRDDQGRRPARPAPAVASAPDGQDAALDRAAGARRETTTHAGRGGILGGPLRPEAFAPAAEGADAEGAGTSRGISSAIGAWARRIAAGRGTGRGAGGRDAAERLAAEAAALRDRAPDPACVLVTALGPGPRLWERTPEHPDALTVRLGTADLPTGAADVPAPSDGPAVLPAVPVTVDLRRSGSLGLAGPRPRLSGLARSVVAQLCALHAPATVELVLISADRERPAEQRADEWGWLNWLPHLRPAHGQDCRLLVAFDRDQAEARTAELARRLADGPLGPGWAGADDDSVAAAAAGRGGGFTVVVVDGDPGSAALRETVERLAHAGPAAGIHLVCLADSVERLPARCGAVARLEGEVATALTLLPEGPGQVTVDAVSGAWAERFGRALAPLREADGAGPRVRSALPPTARLLDELDLALATPAKISARWRSGAAGRAVLGAGPEGPVAVDLVADGPHLLVGGAPGSGKTELLRSLTAALAASAPPDELALVLLDGAPERGEGLRLCTDLPHVTTYLAAADPARMRQLAQALGAELRRREELLGPVAYEAWRAARVAAGPASATAGAAGPAADGAEPGSVALHDRTGAGLPRLVLVVDDFDALAAPALGSPGRPAAGSVVRAVEAVARAGARLGVHLMAATGRPERTAGTEADELARLRIALRTGDAESATLLVHVEEPAALDESVPGRGYLRRPDGAVTAFQTGRVSGRIPRTATLRPTVVPVEWERMGDPPARRPVRELGNGPTDLALLASALHRAAESVGAQPGEPLL